MTGSIRSSAISSTAKKLPSRLLTMPSPSVGRGPENAVAIEHEDLHARSGPFIGVIVGLSTLHPHQNLVGADLEFGDRALAAHGLEQRSDGAITQHRRGHVGGVAGNPAGASTVLPTWATAGVETRASATNTARRIFDMIGAPSEWLPPRVRACA
ncbi:MAG: hypothetical protein NVV63_11690 [Opitutus sp.]|nr:hypothetical protein [Opitutus sp.]